MCLVSGSLFTSDDDDMMMMMMMILLSQLFNMKVKTHPLIAVLGIIPVHPPV